MKLIFWIIGLQIIASTGISSNAIQEVIRDGPHPARFGEVPQQPMSSTASDSQPEVVKFDIQNSCASVEGRFIISRGDDGSIRTLKDPFSDCARALLGIDPGTESNHEAATTLKSCVGPGRDKTILIGHGVPGLLLTGGGHHIPPSPNQAISATGSTWQKEFVGLKTSQLTLFGCWSGAESQGAELVNQMRDATKTLVQAQNAVVFCKNTPPDQGFYIDANFTWVFADPSHDAIMAPQVDQDISQTAILKLKKDQNRTYQEFTLSPATTRLVSIAISSSAISEYDPKHSFHAQGHDAKTRELLTGKSADLVRLVDFGHPFEPGIPDLVLTGMFDLEINNKAHRFNILGYSIVQDNEHHEVLYRMNTKGFIAFSRDLQLKWEALNKQ